MLISFLKGGLTNVTLGKNGVKSGSNPPSPEYLGCGPQAVIEEGLSVYHSVQRRAVFVLVEWWEINGDLGRQSSALISIRKTQCSLESTEESVWEREDTEGLWAWAS